MNLLHHFDHQQIYELKAGDYLQNHIGAQVEPYSTDMLIGSEPPNIVILSVCEPGEQEVIFQIRNQLYQLYFPANRIQIADLGHFTGSIEELPEILLRIRQYGSLPLLISPAQSLTVQIYLSYCLKEETINFVSVDDQPDLQEHAGIAGENNWLTHIIAHTPNYLFNYSLLGQQNYLSNPDQLKTLQDFHFDLLRLGQIRNAIDQTEPIFRNADFFSFDVSSIRNADSPASFRSGPNGLYAEEACQLMRYAGLSNKINSGIIAGWSPLSSNQQTNSLVAQLIWHFLDGYASRIPDGKIGNESDYTIYKVSSSEVEDELVFYKNNRNGRWWMNVPSHMRSHGKPLRYHLVPCNYQDYQQAMKGDIPDTWWNTYQKLS